MNSLEALRVQKPGGIAEYHPAVTRDRRNRPPAAIRQRLRAVANHLPALKQLRNKGMLREILQHVLRIQPRVRIIEAGDEADRNDVVLPAINPRAAILFRRKRPAHGVDYFARRNASRRDLPQLFYSLTVSLRIAVFHQIELGDELLGQRPTRAFRQNDYLRIQVISRLEI